MVILGNIVAFVASIFMVSAGMLKKKKSILLCQCMELSLYTVSNIILGGIPGAIINFLGVIGNVLGYKNILNTVSKTILTILTIVLTLLFNNLGLVGYLPLICMVMYLWTLDIKDVIKFKSFILIIMVFWCIYDYSVKSYVASTFDILTIISTIISMIHIKKGKKTKK